MIREYFKRFITEEDGSATIEFAALAIPLFLPLFIYMNSFASMSDGQDSLRTLAREAARGFVTSSNDEIAYQVAHEIVTQGAMVLGYQDSIKGGQIQMHIDCSTRPCISPDSAIRITLTRTEENRPTITVSALEYVSPWA